MKGDERPPRRKPIVSLFLDDGLASTIRVPLNDDWVGVVRPQRLPFARFGKDAVLSDAEIKERAAKRLADALKNT